MELLVVVGALVHVPDEEPASRDIAVVVAAGVLPILDEKVLVGRDGNLVDGPAPVDLLYHDILQTLCDGDEVLVVPTEPAQVGQRPGAESVGSVLHIPSEGAQTHDPPLADAGAVLLVGQFVTEENRGLIEEIGQTQEVAELVAHGRGRHRERLSALGGTAEAVETAANPDKAARGGDIVADEIHVQPQAGQPGSRADEEVARHRKEIDEDHIDIAVVVAGIGNPVRAVVVEQTHVHISVCLLENIEIEEAEFPLGAGCVGDVRRGRFAGGVAARQHLPLHPQLST